MMKMNEEEVKDIYSPKNSLYFCAVFHLKGTSNVSEKRSKGWSKENIISDSDCWHDLAEQNIFFSNQI